MCVQVPCVYLLSTASTVIRNSYYIPHLVPGPAVDRPGPGGSCHLNVAPATAGCSVSLTWGQALMVAALDMEGPGCPAYNSLQQLQQQQTLLSPSPGVWAWWWPPWTWRVLAVRPTSSSSRTLLGFSLEWTTDSTEICFAWKKINYLENLLKPVNKINRTCMKVKVQLWNKIYILS